MNGGWEWVKQNWWQLLILVAVAAGAGYQVKANTDELEYRRPLIDKIPHMESTLNDLRVNQRKILCRLGDLSFCDSGGPR